MYIYLYLYKYVIIFYHIVIYYILSYYKYIIINILNKLLYIYIYIYTYIYIYININKNILSSFSSTLGLPTFLLFLPSPEVCQTSRPCHSLALSKTK